MNGLGYYDKQADKKWEPIIERYYDGLILQETT